MKRLLRLVLVALALVGLTTTFSAEPAAAWRLVKQGQFCEGINVRRCVWMNLSVNGDGYINARGYAAVRDDQGPYRVYVHEIILFVDTGSGWRQYRHIVNASDAVRVEGHGGLFSTRSKYFRIKVRAVIGWTGGSSPQPGYELWSKTGTITDW